MVKILMSLWAPLVALAAIVEWIAGAMTGRWAATVCLLAAGYVIAIIGWVVDSKARRH